MPMLATSCGSSVSQRINPLQAKLRYPWNLAYGLPQPPGGEDILMARWVLILILALLAVPVAEAQTGNEEGICRNDPNVFFCENFEDRAVGSVLSDPGPRYKNKGWTASTSTPHIQTTEHFDGTKALRMVTPANRVSGGAIDSAFTGRRTVYYRWYQKWSSNYVYSPVATKGGEHLINGVAKTSLFTQLAQSGDYRASVFRFLSEPCWTSGFGSPCLFLPNMNGGAFHPTLNRWYCLEVHVTLNTLSTAKDGYFQAWVDGVQRWDYPNVNLESRDFARNHVNNPQINGFFVVSYWNCDANENCSATQYNHPEMYRYIDSIVGSTRRIGCLGSATDPAPSSPSGLTVR